jgi:hypothetical protein
LAKDPFAHVDAYDPLARFSKGSNERSNPKPVEEQNDNLDFEDFEV